MTFLNPIALFGLIAAGIPILLHFLNLRKLKTIEFSTLSFLKELQKTKIRRLKLRQLLLLILRILLIVLIVFAFSRPTLKGSFSGALSEQAKTSAVILFDDSQSMTANDEHGELLQQAKKYASEIINLLKDGDEIILIKLSDVANIGNSETKLSGIKNFTAVRKTINEIKPSYIYCSIEDGLRYSARYLAESKNFNREIYILSDFQSGSLESETKIVKSAEQIFPPNVQLFLIPLGKRKQQNIAIENIFLPNSIFAVERPFTVKAQLSNYGSTDIQNHLVSIYQNGVRVAQKGIEIRSGQSAEISFSLVPKRTGIIEGMVEIEDDDLEFDNRRYFTVTIPEILNILLIGNSADLFYLRQAFSVRLSDSSTIMKITETTWERFLPYQLNNADVVVLTDIHEHIKNQIRALKDYLNNGGGAIFFPSPLTTVNGYNSNVANILGISKIVSSINTELQKRKEDSYLEFDKVDLRHPLFEGMFDEHNAKQMTKTPLSQHKIESPRILNSINLLSSPQSKSIITLTNGFPFLIEEKVGKGRVMVISVAPNIEWSNFPIKALFVPLIHRATSYLAQRQTTNNSLVVAEEINFQYPKSNPTKITITKPDGKEVLINVTRNSKSISFYETDIPGIYKISTDRQIFNKFSVNINLKESNTKNTERKQHIALMKRLGIDERMAHNINSVEELNRSIIQSRIGTELWRHFIIIALIIALIEMVMARDTKKSLK